MERGVGMNDREQVTRILGLPPERIDYLHDECDMPFDDEGFTAWFIANAALVLQELKQYGPITRWQESMEKKPEEA